MMRKYIAITLAILVSAAAIVFFTYFGAANITFAETSKIILYKIFGVFSSEVALLASKETIIWQLRFPRALLAFLVGGGLALSGAVYQAIFKNPMADPYILGISSGAAFGATIGIILKIPGSYLGLNLTNWLAFAGSILTVFFVYNIAKVGRSAMLTSLLLTGTAVSQFLTAFISLAMMLSANEMRRIYYWTLGSFNSKGWSHVGMVLPYIAISVIYIYIFSRDLDIIMLGDDTAVRYGIDVEKVKSRMFVVTALLMSACVSVSGIIGFVGLVSPHIMRLFTGPLHKKLMPAAFFFGGALLCMCDTIARSAANSEIPVGIVTALCGAPFFIYLLRAKRTEVI
ncbi:MAG: iron ABC transporter permease [Eubacteriaceae bacterium]|nr:iron ABC transporter permease [Eubacteriaceae bacterium]